MSQPQVGQLPIRYYRATELPGCTPTKTATLQLPVHTSSGLHVSQAAQFSKVTFKDSSQKIPFHHRLHQTLLKETSVGYHTRGALPVGDRHIRLDVPYMVRGLVLASTPALSVGVALRTPPFFSTVTATAGRDTICVSAEKWGNTLVFVDSAPVSAWGETGGQIRIACNLESACGTGVTITSLVLPTRCVELSYNNPVNVAG